MKRMSVCEKDLRKFIFDGADFEMPKLVRRNTADDSQVVSSRRKVLDSHEIFEDYFGQLDEVLNSLFEMHNENINKANLRESAQFVVDMLNEKRANLLKSRASIFTPEIELLAVRLMEVQCALRKEIVDEMTLNDTKDSIVKSLEFTDRLEAVSEKLGQLKGAVFQECLGRGHHLPKEFPSMASYPIGLVCIENILNAFEEETLVQQAISLCNLVRVKLADDNDLKTGMAILVDAKEFFDALDSFAAKNHVSPYEACSRMLSSFNVL